ncbi:MAG: nicotinate-nucleotide adenylyltransferase [Bacteroidales bacterium]|nr:nicotinate-nucleotide adenylyltransferase [Bacteroidales bacterium]
MSEPVKTKKVGLFFGSFNPIHTGHMIIAGYMLHFTDLDDVWFIISPHNPLKEKSTLLADHHRYMMVQTAIEDNPRLRASNIEFKLPQPSYTIDTLIRLEEKHPDHQFVLIAGTDIFPTFHKWKNYEVLLENYRFYIYNRPGYEAGTYSNHPNVVTFNAPLMEISSSFIRQAILEGRDIRYFVPEKVYTYIREMHFYEKNNR